MRAVDIALLLLFINVGIAAMATQIGGEGLYQENRPVELGKSPSEMGSPSENISDISSIPGLTIGNIFTGPKRVLLAIGIVFGIAAAAGIFTNASILRIGGISLFGGVFWWVWMETNGLLSSGGIKPWMLNIITMIYGAVFFLAIIELTTGTRVEKY